MPEKSRLRGPESLLLRQTSPGFLLHPDAAVVLTHLQSLVPKLGGRALRGRDGVGTPFSEGSCLLFVPPIGQFMDPGVVMLTALGRGASTGNHISSICM